MKEFCPHKEIFTTSLKGELIMLVEGEYGAQTRLSDAQSDRMQNADITLYDTDMQLQSQRMEVYQANQLTDQIRREKLVM